MCVLVRANTGRNMSEWERFQQSWRDLVLDDILECRKRPSSSNWSHYAQHCKETVIFNSNSSNCSNNNNNNNNRSAGEHRVVQLLKQLFPRTVQVSELAQVVKDRSETGGDNRDSVEKEAGPCVERTKHHEAVATTSTMQGDRPPAAMSGRREGRRKRPENAGFPRTTVTATPFSGALERLWTHRIELKPDSNLVEMPKGDPPPLDQVYNGVGLPPGHVCVVGPTGSGKSTIVRAILVQLLSRMKLSIYTMEFPVEVSLNTHGLYEVCQIDMLQMINGKQRQLAETANMLLKHDPDLLYFGELRTKIDFETATSISLSGVAVISTGHAHSPMDLLERLRSMNIDLQTQFRAFRTVIGVKRVPILCEKCKQHVMLNAATSNRALKLFNMYRITSLPRTERWKVHPIVCMPPPPESVKCTCNGGYTHTHTIYEFLYIYPNDDLESLRARHTYSTEETLITLIMEGKVNPLYLESFV